MLLFYMFLLNCHEEVFMLFGHFIDIICLVCLGKSIWSLSYFWNVFFSLLLKCIFYRSKFDVWYHVYKFLFECFICSHYGGMLFVLNPKSSLPISLSCFSCKKKWALQCICFTTLSIFWISLIRYDSLDGIGMFFNDSWCLIFNDKF